MTQRLVRRVSSRRNNYRLPAPWRKLRLLKAPNRGNKNYRKPKKINSSLRAHTLANRMKRRQKLIKRRKKVALNRKEANKRRRANSGKPPIRRARRLTYAQRMRVFVSRRRTGLLVQRRRQLVKAEEKTHHRLTCDRQKYLANQKQPSDVGHNLRRLFNGFQRNGNSQRLEQTLRTVRRITKKSHPDQALPFYKLFTAVGIYRVRRGGAVQAMPTVISGDKSLQLGRTWLRNTFKRQKEPDLAQRIINVITKPPVLLRDQHNAHALTNLAYL